MAFLDILSGFRVNGQFPVDSRIVAANEAARYAIPTGAVYEGLVVFEESTKKLFVLDDLSNANNIDGWTEVGGSGSEGLPEVTQFQSGAGGTLNETFWIGTLEQYNARTDAQKDSETIHFVTDDLTPVTGAGDNPVVYLLSDFGITSTAAQIDHAAEQLDGITLSNDLVTSDSTTVFTNKSGAISQWTNDSGYLTTQISHTNVVDESSTITVNADSTQTNGGSVDAQGNLTINVDLPDLSLLITRQNVLSDDFNPTGLWDFRNADVLIGDISADVDKASIDAALNTSAASPNTFYGSNNGGAWSAITLDDNSIVLSKLDLAVRTSLGKADSALQSLPTVDLSNLSTGVQASLGKADSALQSLPTIELSNLSTGVQASLGKADSAIQSIPTIELSGLSTGVQASLGKADSALQNLTGALLETTPATDTTEVVTVVDTSGTVTQGSELLSNLTNSTQEWSDVQNTPTTFAGYGLPSAPTFSVETLGFPDNPAPGQEVYFESDITGTTRVALDAGGTAVTYTQDNYQATSPFGAGGSGPISRVTWSAARSTWTNWTIPTGFIGDNTADTGTALGLFLADGTELIWGAGAGTNGDNLDWLQGDFQGDTNVALFTDIDSVIAAQGLHKYINATVGWVLITTS